MTKGNQYCDKIRPCAKCPFLRTALAGWLGPWQVDELLFALGRRAFPCHLTIKGSDMKEGDPELRGCAGAAHFLNNKHERSRHPLNQAHQDLVASHGARYAPLVFANSVELRNHHTPKWEQKG